MFISSLISGFEPFRAAAKAAVKSLGHEPVMAEDFPAQPRAPQLACLSGLRSAQLVVLVLGERYGAVQDASGVSPTHEEYLAARDGVPILLFVQEGVEPEPLQARLLADAQGWQAGLYRKGFSTADELREKVTQGIHAYELSNAAGPLDTARLAKAADELLPRNGRESGSPMLLLALMGGPSRQVLRPAELESSALAKAIHQQGLFGPAPIFDGAEGLATKLDGDALVLEQERGACARLDERGGLLLRLPLNEPRGRKGFAGAMMGLVEETVLAQLRSALAFADWTLDKIDATQLLTHVALSARIDAADYLGWRTQAEQEANPNSGTTIRMGGQEQEPVRLDRPRGALKFEAPRLAEDMMVRLRRQRRA